MKPDQYKITAMRNFLITWPVLFFFCDSFSQTLIGTSYSSDATANHNQRKLVRDSSENIYVVFTDTANQESVIKGVKYQISSGLWSNETILFNGNNPTISISKNGKIHLTYESNDSVTRIMNVSTYDFNAWSYPLCLSDTLTKNYLPVADVDSSGKLNVLWIEKNGALSNTLIYAEIVNDTLLNRITVTTRNVINDVTIANHLQYYNNVLLFAIQFNADSILFFRTSNNMLSFDTLYESVGSQPCITYNSSSEYINPEDDMARFLHIDNTGNLIETEFVFNLINTITEELIYGVTIDYVCIDNIAPPIGYSYLFLNDGCLYHGFSYGSHFWGNFNTILDSISGYPFNPSIAYKSFNFFNVDFIWMEDAGTHYNIYYKRDAKHIWLDLQDVETGKGFSITGNPNPFSEFLTIKLSVDENEQRPIIKIYNSNSQLINILKPLSVSQNDYEYRWYGLNQNGEKVTSGTYIIMCNIGNKAVARKVTYFNNK